MIQCFVKNGYSSSFEDNKLPRLIHVCKAEKRHNKFPRIMHLHEDMVEIVLIREGSGTHIVGDRKYKTQKGDILIYNKGILHDERSNPETDVSTYACGITSVNIKGLKENCLLSDDIEPVISSGEYFNKIESIFDMMYSELLSGSNGAEETCNYLLLGLVTIVLRIIEASGNEAGRESYQIGERIKKYIDDNFLCDLSIKSLSEDLGISQYYLIHTFKEKTGYSPMQYIIDRKLGEAQNLLINTNYSIEQIAAKIGYDNPNYFTMLFAKKIGMSPGKYRKQFITRDDSGMK